MEANRVLIANPPDRATVPRADLESLYGLAEREYIDNHLLNVYLMLTAVGLFSLSALIIFASVKFGRGAGEGSGRA
jgi:hypothetical protein